MLQVGSVLYAQDEFEDISASGLLTTATGFLADKNYFSAVPYMEAYLDRMEEMDDARVISLMQEVRLKIGKILGSFEEYESKKIAVDYLRQYTEKLPLYKPCEAFTLLAVNLNDLGALIQKEAQNGAPTTDLVPLTEAARSNYVECIVAARYALTRPLSKDAKEQIVKIDNKKLSKKERGGFSARQLDRVARKERERAEKVEKEREEDLSKGFSGGKVDAEPEYTTRDLVLLNWTLGEAFTALERWEESLAPYQFVIDKATDESRQGYAILKMVEALVNLERFTEAGEFVIQLYRTNARYDIRMNMALMKVGFELFRAGEVDSALMIYRMVLPRTDMVAYQEAKMNELLRGAGRPEVIITVVTNELGRVETLFGTKTSNLSLQDEFSDSGDLVELPPKPAEVFQLEELINTLVSLPPYETEVLYRTGAIYAKAGRPWEAVLALSQVAKRDLNGELGQRAFAESLLVLVDPLAEYERVEKLAMQFLKFNTEGLAPRLVAHALTFSYQKQEQWKKIKDLLPVIEGFVPSREIAIRDYECELYFMQAMADLMLFEYEPAKTGFAKVLADFPGLHQQENATHWHAMCQAFLKNYAEALVECDAYPVAWPEGKWLSEEEFHSGICLFGLEKMEEAQERFTKVIDTWPDSSVYPDARSLRGDLLAAKGDESPEMLTRAQKDYEAAIAAPQATVKQDTYAVFQMVAMFDLEERYPKMIDKVEAYLDRRGETGDVAKAAYWIGKTKLAQAGTATSDGKIELAKQKVDEAMGAYRQAIVTYGGNILQDGVDLIITEMARVAKRRLETDQRAQLEEQLREDAAAADNETLRLRLRVLLAKMDGSELELGKELIVKLSDLTQAPPPVLSVICKASFAAEDYSRAKEILQIFLTRYEDSDFMREAYKLRGYDLFAAGEMDEAMKIVKAAQETYGVQRDIVWAQMMKGRIELQQNRFTAAEKTFRDLLTVREWRGEPYAEATFRLGELGEKAGHPRQAFAWYQRVYVQYKGYAKGAWAADAYLASARCLEKIPPKNDQEKAKLVSDRRNTFRALLFDKYVNKLPQADVAREALGAVEVMEIATLIEQNAQTNVVVVIEQDAQANAVESVDQDLQHGVETIEQDAPAHGVESIEQDAPTNVVESIEPGVQAHGVVSPEAEGAVE